jgi:hypothetical protein
MQPLLRMLANRLRATTRQHVDHQSGDLVTRARRLSLAEADGMSFGTLVRVEVTQTELATWVGEPGSDQPRSGGCAIGAGSTRPEPDRRLNVPALQRLAADAWSGPAWSSTR